MMMRMMTVSFAMALAASTLLAADAPKPVYAWDFDKDDGKGHAANVGSGSHETVLYVSEMRAGQGVGSSNACSVGKDDKESTQRPLLPLKWKAYTFDLSFSVDAVPTGRAPAKTLLQYMWAIYRRGEMKLAIVPDGRLEVSFTRRSKDPALNVEKRYTSGACAIRPGVFHAVRLTGAENGDLRLYLDGVEVLRAAGTPGLLGVEAEPPKWYPFLRLGADASDPEHPKDFLGGLLDDVRLYNVALGAPEIVLPKTAADYSGVSAPQFRAVALAGTAVSAGAAESVEVFGRTVAVRDANYDTSKIAPYELEDPLTFLDGRKVRTAADWAERRREILGIFAREMYGAEPPKPEALVTELRDEKVAVGGFAVRRQYRMWFKADRSGPCVNWIVWIPRQAKKAVPVILGFNFRGNHELVPDEDIEVMSAWCRNDGKAVDHRAQEKTRGLRQDPNGVTVFPLGMILARGYAVMSACYCEVSPDPDPAMLAADADRYPQGDLAYTGVFALWGRRDPARTDDITAIGAWAWALSRGLDLAERIPGIDARRSVVTGNSRLGKAALLAAARDERFRVCVPNQTGGGGCPLAKRDYGENVSTECRMFSHWYCVAYAKYAADPARLLTFDQHLLLACIAPRALLVEGFDGKWFDTEGEYLAVKAASPVWELLGREGLPGAGWPDDYDTSAIGRDLGYVRRTEAHGIAACDWAWLLDFSDRILKVD